MQAGRRSGHGAPDMGIERLVALQVEGLGLAVKVWRNRNVAADLEYIGKRDASAPAELHHSRPPGTGNKAGGKLAAGEFGMKYIVFPALGIPYHTAPGAGFGTGEAQVVLNRFDGLETENLDMGSGLATEMQPSRNDLRIIEDHEGAGRKLFGNVPEHTVRVYDGIRGELEKQENYQDFVLLKSDGIPTYHFAHVVDDHLMRTTHVVRGEEWLPSLPIHVELFEDLGWELPVYCHTAQLMKIGEDGNKRKLSK
ncbi:MAG: hypothetical protein IJ799_05585, partial [Bacteroidales bacterium]|nr:hypothetical protein [Bacteroidales bacterium]